MCCHNCGVLTMVMFCDKDECLLGNVDSSGTRARNAALLQNLLQPRLRNVKALRSHRHVSNLALTALIDLNCGQ